MIYLQLFYTFFKIGLLGFGGGYGMLSLIQFEIVERYQWLSVNQFTDIVAISQATPGPIGINSATFVGFSVAGIGGAITATFAVVLPSFILMYVLIKIFNRYKDNHYIKSIMSVMQYVVIGLIASAAVMLISEETFGKGFSNIFAWVILLVAFVAMRFSKISPILLILIGGVVGWLFL
ncbi:MAG: chromate transporter [Porphyromonadaceae bacterium]|nr:chromate transporter [Porphyromonadaceae bacterium]